MYAQNSILCQFGNLEICPNFANPYLTQFSSISGGNCITSITSLAKPWVAMFPWGCFMLSLLTSASFSYTLSINQCFMPLTTNLTPLLVRKELPDGLALENMLVMPSPTNSLMMTRRKSSTDLLSDPQILPVPTSVWYLMGGELPDPKPIVFVRSRQDNKSSATKRNGRIQP